MQRILSSSRSNSPVLRCPTPDARSSRAHSITLGGYVPPEVINSHVWGLASWGSARFRLSLSVLCQLLPQRMDQLSVLILTFWGSSWAAGWGRRLPSAVTRRSQTPYSCAAVLIFPVAGNVACSGKCQEPLPKSAHIAIGGDASVLLDAAPDVAVRNAAAHTDPPLDCP